MYILYVIRHWIIGSADHPLSDGNDHAGDSNQAGCN